VEAVALNASINTESGDAGTFFHRLLQLQENLVSFKVYECWYWILALIRRVLKLIEGGMRLAIQ